MLLFLDIDGVMVPAKSWVSPELLDDGFAAFSNQSVATLNSIIFKDVVVMLTTTHKATFSIDEWKSIFRNRGIEIENIKSLPENIFHLSRKDEILNWFNKNEVIENFLIIDDDKSLNDLPPFFKNHLLLTSSQIGLTKAHLADIKSILYQTSHLS